MKKKIKETFCKEPNIKIFIENNTPSSTVLKSFSNISYSFKSLKIKVT